MVVIVAQVSTCTDIGLLDRAAWLLYCVVHALDVDLPDLYVDYVFWQEER